MSGASEKFMTEQEILDEFKHAKEIWKRSVDVEDPELIWSINLMVGGYVSNTIDDLIWFATKGREF